MVFAPAKIAEDTARLNRTLKRLAVGHSAERDRFVYGPVLIYAMWAEGDLYPDLLAGVLLDVWAMSDYPASRLDQSQWLDLFSFTGFIREGKRDESSRPQHSMTLYRGCDAAGRAGWSWTGKRDVAVRFANEEIDDRPIGTIWTAGVPPEALLGYSDDRQEDEWIVNTINFPFDITEDT